MAIDPFVLGSLVTGGAGLLSSLFGGGMSNAQTNAVNRTNMAIARENNRTQIAMWEAQNRINNENWNRDAEYNSPSSQAARLRAAGINPALAMSNISTGTMQSQPAGSPPSMQTPQLTPKNYGYLMDAARIASDSVAQAVNAQNLRQDIASKSIDNAFRLRKNILETRKLMYDAKSSGLNVENLRLSNKMMNDTYQSQLALAQSSASRAATEAKLSEVDLTMREFERDVQELRYSREVRLSESQIKSVEQGIRSMAVNMAVSQMDAQTNRMNAVTNRMNASTNYQAMINNGKAIMASIDNMKRQGRLLDLNAEGIVLDNKGKRIHLSYQLMNEAASLNLLIQQGKLTQNQAAHELVKVAKTTAETANIATDTAKDLLFFFKPW